MSNKGSSTRPGLMAAHCKGRSSFGSSAHGPARRRNTVLVIGIAPIGLGEHLELGSSCRRGSHLRTRSRRRARRSRATRPHHIQRSLASRHDQIGRVFGMLDGIGEATWSTYSTPSMAASQPFGAGNSASTNDKESIGSLRLQQGKAEAHAPLLPR